MFARVPTQGIALRRAAAARRVRRHVEVATGRTRRPRCCSTSRPTACTRASTWRPRATSRRRRGRRARGAGAERLDRRAAAAAGRARRHGDPRHPRPRVGAPGGRRRRRRDGARPAPAGVGSRSRTCSAARLEGGRAGVTGLPSDVAVLRSVVAGDGGDPDRVRGHDRLRGGRRCSPAVSTARRRSGTSRASRCASGGPTRASSASTTTARPRTRSSCCASAAARSRRSARGRGDDPSPPARIYAGADRPRERGLRSSRRTAGSNAAAQAQLDAVAPAFTAGARAYGELREDVLRQWSRWDVEFGILEHGSTSPRPSTSRSSVRCRTRRFGERQLRRAGNPVLALGAEAGDGLEGRAAERMLVELASP